MLNYDKLAEIVEEYKKAFQERWDDEKFKWVAAKHFQDNWDISAPDFLEMFCRATDKTHNLLTSKNFFPLGMMIDLIKVAPEVVRSIFKGLFDEGQPLGGRIQTFISNIDTLNSRYFPNKNHYQTDNAISTYLWLRYPDKYYIYKYSEYKKVIKLISPETEFKKGDKNNILTGFKLYDEICDYLYKDIELRNMLKQSLTTDCYPDNFLKTLTIDVGYYVSRQVMDENDLSDLDNDDENSKDYNGVRYWICASGENAEKWDECYRDGILVLGWDELGDFRKFNDRDAVKKAIQRQGKDNPRNDSRAVWEFCNVMKEGDIVFMKKGRTKILGRGVVKSGYIYDENRRDYKNVRKVDWKAGDWQLNEEWSKTPLPTKTLTDITKYQDWAQRLDEITLGNGATAPNRNYWWLNAKPSIWSFGDIQVGEEQNYTLYNESGHKRRVFENFKSAKVGDLIIGYESTPVKKIVALAEVSRDTDDEYFYFKKTKDLSEPIDYEALKNIPGLENMEYLKSSQGSLFKLSENEYNTIIEMTDDEDNPLVATNNIVSYKPEDFLNDVFMSGDEYRKLRNLILYKQNVILQGAPGVGKTFMAKRLAYSMMGEKDNNRIEIVQFHQSYSYEDFIMGYKPTKEGFELRTGVFYNFCKKAEKDLEHKYFFIIDEINRGNLSKIFGELLMLIENDKRGPEYAAKLAYSDEKFYVPQNLYIIGMMNTADRSLAIMDYALRRRFSFYYVEPAFDKESFIKHLEKNKISFHIIEHITEKFTELNTYIADETQSNLGKGFCIGHSYFCTTPNPGQDDADWYNCIVDYEIGELLKEYWWDEPQKAEDWINRLKI